MFIFLCAFAPLLYSGKNSASLHPVLQAACGIETYLFAADILSLPPPTAVKFRVILTGSIVIRVDFLLVAVDFRPFSPKHID